MHRTRSINNFLRVTISGSLLLFCVIYLSVISIYAQKIKLDGFAARVNGTVILESDVTAEISIINQQAIIREKNPPEFTRSDILEELINRELFLQQARRFISRTITEHEVTERLKKLDKTLGNEEQRKKFFRQNHIDPEFWRARVRNQLILEKYMEQRIQAFVRISVKNEDQYLTENASELGLVLSETPVKTISNDHSLRKMVRRLLTIKAIEERRTELLEDLKIAAEITYSSEDIEIQPDESSGD
ncbi:SurA N-terminal domain-containing protein [bacterium]|nr:SurA N-terminal domain-containing protein [bacterium]